MKGLSPEEVLARYRRLDTCVVCDAAAAIGAGAAVTDRLRPMWEGARVAGRAVTTRLAPGPSPRPSAHLGVRAIENGTPDDVIVVANAGRREMGSWGGLLSLGASIRGIAGAVIDGALRDVDDAREFRFPVFAVAATPVTARGRVHEESCGEPVEVSGAHVDPGDLVLGDGSGVLVVPWAAAGDVLERAEKLAHQEEEMASRLRAGLQPSAVLGSSYESMLGAAAEGGS